MARDMTRGSIARTLLMFLLPLIASGLLQQLYGWADALIVGNFAGEKPLAAVGATGSVSHLFLNIIMGFTAGVSILAAQSWGEGDALAVRRAASAFLVVLGCASLAVSAAAFFAVKPLLAMLKTPGDITEMASEYLAITLIGIPFMALYNTYAAILRGIGDSRTPLYAVAVSAAANVALDLALVAGFGWGVAGAAIATVLAQACMTVYVFFYCRAKYPAIFGFARGENLLDREAIARGLRLGVPTAIQYAIRSLCSLPLQQVMNAFGTATVAAITTAYRIDSLILLPVVNLDAGISTFVAQNMGAGDAGRAKKSLRVGVGIGIVVSILIAAAVVPLGGSIMRWFGITQEAIAIGRRFFWDIAPFYPLFAVLCVYTGYLRGSGDVAFAGAAGIAAQVVRVLLSYLLAPHMGSRVIAWAEALAWTFQFLLFAFRYLQLRRRDRGIW